MNTNQLFPDMPASICYDLTQQIDANDPSSLQLEQYNRRSDQLHRKKELKDTMYINKKLIFKQFQFQN